MALGKARARNPDDPGNVAALSEPAMAGIVPDRVGSLCPITDAGGRRPVLFGDEIALAPGGRELL